MSYKHWDQWSDFITLLIVVPTHPSDITGQALMRITHLLKLQLLGNARSGEPFCCGWHDPSSIPCLINIGTAGAVSSPFSPIVPTYQTCHSLSLHCTFGYILFRQSHTSKVPNSECSGQSCLPYRLLFCISIRYARITNVMYILLLLRPYRALTLAAQKPDVDPC